MVSHGLPLITLCLLLLGQPAMAQKVKRVVGIFGTTAELPWVAVFDASLRSTASAGANDRLELFTDTNNIVAEFSIPREIRAGRAA
jgi:hypothetical protein